MKVVVRRLLTAFKNLCVSGEYRHSYTQTTSAHLRLFTIGPRGFPKILTTPVQPLPLQRSRFWNFGLRFWCLSLILALPTFHVPCNFRSTLPLLS